MKTHIIHLDHDDNVVSITDKLSWGKAQRVLLVYPHSQGLNLRKIDLLLIKRAAKRMGFSLGIVSRTKSVKLLALEVRIPVFKSIKLAQRRTWAALSSGEKKFLFRKSATEIRKIGLEAKIKEPGWKNRIGVRLFFFSLGVLSVFLIILLFIPSAKIKLNLQAQTQMMIINLNVDETVDNVNLSGIIPVHKKNVTVEGIRLVNINSRTSLPDKYSVGKIFFTNLTENKVRIPLGLIISRLDKSGVRFEVIETGDLQAGVGQTIELPVRALTPGQAGNMEANSLGSIIGDLGTSLLAINPDPTFGGTDRIAKMANESDRNSLLSLLESDLRVEALKSAQEQLAKGDIILPETIKISEILKEIYVPIAGQPGDRLSLELRVSYSMQYTEYSDLVTLGETVLNAGLPAGYLPQVGDNIIFNLLKNPTTNSNGTTTLRLQAHRKIIKEINGFYITRLVKGLSTQEAYNIINEKFGPETKPVVELSPSWWPRLPIVTLRIAVFD